MRVPRGPIFYDLDERDYLDFLSGYSVYNIGRNHPAVAARHHRCPGDGPAQYGADGLFAAQRSARGGAAQEIAAAPRRRVLLQLGRGGVEGAIKFARAATGRTGLLSLHGSFHGLTNGALSVMGDEHFREGFGPLLEHCARVKLGNLAALEEHLARRNVAALVIEPVQGKGVHFPADDFYREAQRLCREHGTLLICDEVQTGLGRTGRWWGFEHWGLEPDIITVAKSLSGGYVPCAAVVARRAIYQKTFSRLDRCVVHSSTFGATISPWPAGSRRSR